MKKVISFLTQLRENNNKEWFDAHRAQYKEVQAEVNSFAAGLIDGIADFDASVGGLAVKDCTYRIYRDVRFSHDKTPYKTHIGIYVCPGGKKSGNSGYYFHIEPSGAYGAEMFGGHLLTTGIYMPEPKVLRSLREDIAYNGGELLAAVAKAKSFRLNTDNMLKRVPAGFPVDNPYAEYLKMKDFYVQMRVDNDFMESADLLERSIAAFRETYELNVMLNRVIDYAREEM